MREKMNLIDTSFKVNLNDFSEIPEESSLTEDILLSTNEPELDDVEPMILYGCCCNNNCCGCW